MVTIFVGHILCQSQNLCQPQSSVTIFNSHNRYQPQSLPATIVNSHNRYPSQSISVTIFNWYNITIFKSHNFYCSQSLSVTIFTVTIFICYILKQALHFSIFKLSLSLSNTILTVSSKITAKV